MSEDEQELDTLGDRKTALFVIISDTDDTFNFVVSIMYSQLFNLLCDKADDVYGGRLPVHVRCLLDEFANIGLIPKFEKLIATIRSREISASIILQAQSQLKAIYKNNADTIVGNCDSTLFLGGKEQTTLKELSEILGKETIDLYNTSETRSNQKSFGLNYQKTGKELMSQDEITVMDGSKCMLLTGMGYIPIITGTFFGFLADITYTKGRFTSAKLAVLANGFFSIWCWGNYYELFFNPDAYWSTRQVYGEGYINAVRALFPTYMAPVLVAVCFVSGIFGGLLGRVLLKKHFKRAGIA